MKTLQIVKLNPTPLTDTDFKVGSHIHSTDSLFLPSSNPYLPVLSNP